MLHAKKGASVGAVSVACCLPVAACILRPRPLPPSQTIALLCLGQGKRAHGAAPRARGAY